MHIHCFGFGSFVGMHTSDDSPISIAGSAVSATVDVAGSVVGAAVDVTTTNGDEK